MTEFVQETRHYCRNPKCRSRLLKPVANEREAFCARGCYNSFYLHRCRVCECPIEQPKYGQRLLCKKTKCRRAWQANDGFGRYAASSDAKAFQKTLVNAGVKTPLATGLPAGEHWSGTWAVLRVIAGPQISAEGYFGLCSGAGEALAESDRTNDAHWRAAKAGKHGYRRVDAIPPVDAPALVPTAVEGARANEVV